MAEEQEQQQDEQGAHGALGPHGTPPQVGSWEDFWKLAFEHPRFRDLAQRAKEAEAKLKEREEADKLAEKADLEKRREFEQLYTQAQDEITALKAELEQIQADRRATVKQHAVVAAARKAGFNERAAEDVHLFVDLAQIAMSEAGEPDRAQIERLVKALGQERPYMVEKRSDGGSPPGRRTPAQSSGGQAPPVPVRPLTL